MKFLTDENIGLEVVTFLRAIGNNVVSAIESLPGASDITILQKAAGQNRILITSDKDFGELVFNQNFPHSGVILLRLNDEGNANKIRVISLLLKTQKENLENNFVVVTENKIRIRRARKLVKS